MPSPPARAPPPPRYPVAGASTSASTAAGVTGASTSNFPAGKADRWVVAGSEDRMRETPSLPLATETTAATAHRHSDRRRRCRGQPPW